MEELAPVTAQLVVIQSKNVDENDPFGQWRAREGRIKPLADAIGGASTKRGAAMRGLLDRSDDRMNRAIKSDPSELRGRLQTSKATADQLLTRKENIERTYVPQAKPTGGTGNTSLPEAGDKQSQINGSSLAQGGNGVLSSYSEAPDANSNVAVDHVDHVPSPKVTQKNPSKAGTKRPREDQASTSPNIHGNATIAFGGTNSQACIRSSNAVAWAPTPALGPAVLVQKKILSTALGLSKQVESVLGKYVEELRADSEYWNRLLLRRSRLSLASRPAEAAASESANEKCDKPYSGKPYSFANLKPLKLIKVTTGPTPAKIIKFQVQPMSSAGNGTKITLACPVAAIEVQTDMPSYAHYVEVKDNFLAPNVREMQAWPYFNDDFDYTKDGGELKELFSLDVDGRSKKLLRLAQAQKIEGYAESALRDLAITWADVLRFLFAGEEDLAVGSEKDALQALAHRQQSCNEEFTRKADRTAIILSSLALSTPQKLGMAAVLCENFLKMTKFSLWHVARRHMYDAVENKDTQHAIDLELLTCGICLRLDCPYHGTLEEHEEGDEDEETELQPAALTDIVHPPNHASIQRSVTKRTVIGDSRIHGLGLYAGENVKRGEFVGEYKGELINSAETNRRGAVYAHQKLSYLFIVNESQEIDSTYFGTKIRFINHAAPSLFFDYGSRFPCDQLGGKIAGATKSVARTHQVNTIDEDFYEVARVKDVHGNTRATKAGQKGRPGKAQTKHTGPPTGADSRPSRKSTHLEQEGGLEDELGADPNTVPLAAARLPGSHISESGPGIVGATRKDAAAGAEDESDGFEPSGSAEEESEDDEAEEAESEQDEPAKPRRHRNGKLVRVGGKRGGVRR
ncbi:hypothetical protein B0A54_13796 [Friedmanniomyces endolithicus]|uniref:SET domain-containing protein n=1 Tax=Friedmanniomyces endolithicus TaxID=329885 RepID=A0A4U0UI00_9PEZI|nr:hypothetical protein B0A54_13796 [Friedmanniomyces endolithicus]